MKRELWRHAVALGAMFLLGMLVGAKIASAGQQRQRPLLQVCAIDSSSRPYVWQGRTRDRRRLEKLELVPWSPVRPAFYRAVARSIEDRHGRRLSAWVYSDRPIPRPPFVEINCRHGWRYQQE